MGNIPQFNRQFQPSQTMFANPQSAAAMGDAISDAGAFATNAILRKQAKIKQADDFTAVNNAGLKLQDELNTEWEGFSKKNQANPRDKHKEFDILVSDRVKKYRDTLPSEDAKFMFDRYGANLRENYQSRGQEWERTTQVSNFAQRVEDSAQLNNRMAVLDGNLENVDKYLAQAQSTALAGSFITGPAKAEHLAKTNARGAVKSLLMGAAEKNPDAARAALKDEKFNKWLEADDLVTLDNTFTRMKEKQENDLREEKARVSLGNVNSLKAKIVDGNDVEDEAHELFKKGEIDGGQLMTVINAQHKFQKESNDRAAGRQKMDLVQKGQATLNPSEKKDLDAFDDYYKTTFLPTTEGMDEGQKARAVVGMISDFGVVPPTLKSDLQAQIMTGSPEQQAQSSSLISNVVLNNPRAATQFDDQTLSYAMKMSDLSAAGVPLSQAVESAQKTFVSGTPEYQARIKDYQSQTTGAKPAIKFDAGAFTQYMRNDPSEVPFEMKRQWESLAKYYYVDQGNSSGNAMNLANAAIQKTWAITTIGKDGAPRWMQYAPESYYTQGGSEWIQKQLVSDLHDMGVLKTKDVGKVGDPRAKGAHRREVEEFMKSAYLVPVPDNLNAQGKPQYYIYREEAGVQNIVVGTNPKTGKAEALVFSPDYNQTPDGKRITNDLKKAQERADAKAGKAFESFQAQRREKALKEQGIQFQDRALFPSPTDPNATGQGA